MTFYQVFYDVLTKIFFDLISKKWFHSILSLSFHGILNDIVFMEFSADFLITFLLIFYIISIDFFIKFQKKILSNSKKLFLIQFQWIFFNPILKNFYLSNFNKYFIAFQ